MRISDADLERVLVADHVAALERAAEPLALRLRFGRWLVLAGLRLAPELRPVT